MSYFHRKQSFSSVFIFIIGLTGKVILNAENLKQVAINDLRSIYDAPSALFSFTLFTM